MKLSLFHPALLAGRIPLAPIDHRPVWGGVLLSLPAVSRPDERAVLRIVLYRRSLSAARNGQGTLAMGGLMMLSLGGVARGDGGLPPL